MRKPLGFNVKGDLLILCNHNCNNIYILIEIIVSFLYKLSFTLIFISIIYLLKKKGQAILLIIILSHTCIICLLFNTYFLFVKYIFI